MGDKIELKTGDHQVGPVRLQGIDFVDFEFDKELERPALFQCNTTASGNVSIVTWGGSTKVIDCQELDRLLFLIREIKSVDTDLSVGEIYLIR